MSEKLEPWAILNPREERLKERIVQLMEERDGLLEIIKQWNTIPGNKPYKYETEDDWQESCGWFTSEFQEAIKLAFASARERKEG